jgi:hypothetical protein
MVRNGTWIRLSLAALFVAIPAVRGADEKIEGDLKGLQGK